jgi:Ca2+-binding RTX toxin-like protein
MHHSNRRLWPSKVIVAVAVTAGAAAMPAAASAQKTPVPATTATSTEAQGMRYSANTVIGNGPEQQVLVTLTGTTFTIDDIVPIHAGTGCQPVAGDPTKVTCVAYKTAPNGDFKPFTVIMSGGHDRARNLADAPMYAYGGAGNDRLIGASGDDKLQGDSGADVLEGNAGDDDLQGLSGQDLLYGDGGYDKLYGGNDHDRLKGGDNDDLLDGGFDPDVIIGGTDNFGDTVTYSTRAVGVVVDLNDPNALQGQPGEDDLISEVEHVYGGDGADKVWGNASSNRLMGFAGNDQLHGFQGKDIIAGGSGADFLTPSLAPDGVQDIVDCGDYGPYGDDGEPGDIAYRSLADGDAVIDCEQILEL